MMGCKVFLTYKRKRFSGNNGHGNGSMIPVSAPNDTTLCNELIDNRLPEDETGNSSHVCWERGLHCGCVDKQDSTEAPSSTQKSEKLEAKKNTEEFTTGLGSPSSDRADEIPGPHSRDYVGAEPSLKRKNCFESDDTPSMSKTPIKGIRESLGKDKAPLITFVRRCKRKIDDKISNKQSNISPSEKGCDAAGLKTTEARATNDTISQIKIKIPEVDSACQDATILIAEREGTIDGQNVSTTVLHKGEMVVDFPEDTSCKEISLNNATKDSANQGIDVTSAQNSEKIRLSERDESRTPRLVLDLSLIPTDSSGTLESNPEKPYVHCVTETVLGSMDSTSRSHAFVSHQNFPPPEMSNIAKVRLEESVSNHHSCLVREASALVEEPLGSCKENNNTASVPRDFMSQNKCLQLFPEERTEDSFHSVFKNAEDVRKRFRFETENNPRKRKSPPFLGLSLPTKLKTTRLFASTNNNELCTFPFPISLCETEQRSCSGRFSSFLRHKSTMLKWTEEELDSLWVGVRRYGRENWNAMVRDPRLRFSPWRSASELADQWEEEQRKLFQRPSVEETKLSLGDVYNNMSRSRGRNGPRARRARFKSGTNHTQQIHGKPIGGSLYQGVNFSPSTTLQGNLPHWLREAVFNPASLGPSSIACSQMMRVHVAWPCGADRGGGTRGNPDRSFGADRVIVIESDPSSEETISDERCA